MRMEEEMAAWQAAGDSKQVMKVAKRLLAADAGNIRALGIVVALDRVNAAEGRSMRALNEMCQYASGGMLAVPMWRQPANMSPADYVALSKLAQRYLYRRGRLLRGPGEELLAGQGMAAGAP